MGRNYGLSLIDSFWQTFVNVGLLSGTWSFSIILATANLPGTIHYTMHHTNASHCFAQYLGQSSQLPCGSGLWFCWAWERHRWVRLESHGKWEGMQIQSQINTNSGFFFSLFKMVECMFRLNLHSVVCVDYNSSLSYMLTIPPFYLMCRLYLYSIACVDYTFILFIDIYWALWLYLYSIACVDCTSILPHV